MKIARHWISCAKFTAEVGTDEYGTIREAAPVVRKFIGQRLVDLLTWAAKFGGLKHEKLS